ncbi:MAG: outer membrane protein assembly factor BamB family protein [Candidatus Heimdallarchaeaceae archaeon]
MIVFNDGLMMTFKRKIVSLTILFFVLLSFISIKNITVAHGSSFYETNKAKHDTSHNITSKTFFNNSNYKVLWKLIYPTPQYGDITFVDINNDNKLDVLIGPLHPGLFALNGINGSILWTKNFTSLSVWFPYVWCYGANLFDLDNDKELEIILSVGLNRTVYAFEKDSTNIWSYSPPRENIGIAVLGDTNNDLEQEVLVSYSSSKNDKQSNPGGIVSLSPKNGTELWKYEDYRIRASTIVVTDLNDDGCDDVIVKTYLNSLLAVDGKTHTLLWEYSFVKKVSKNNALKSPVIADVDGNGKLEIFAGANDDFFYAIDAETGKKIWEYMTGGNIGNRPALGDLNCDGVLDIIFTSEDGKLYVLDGLKGKLIWSFKFGKSLDSPNCDCFYITFSTPLIGDLNNDNRLDVLIGGCESYYALNGKTGEVLWKFENPSLIERDEAVDIVDTGAIVDLDNDGENEVILVWSGLGIYAYDFHEGVSGKRIYWGTARGNSLQLGSSLAVDQDSDCLSDYSEHFYETDVAEKDTDHDFLPDGYEISCLYTSPTSIDSDNNGINDGDEDFDGDGLTNKKEFRRHTDPFIFDSDTDGIRDKFDLFPYLNDYIVYSKILGITSLFGFLLYSYKNYKKKGRVYKIINYIYSKIGKFLKKGKIFFQKASDEVFYFLLVNKGLIIAKSILAFILSSIIISPFFITSWKERMYLKNTEAHITLNETGSNINYGYIDNTGECVGKYWFRTKDGTFYAIYYYTGSYPYRDFYNPGEGFTYSSGDLGLNIIEEIPPEDVKEIKAALRRPWFLLLGLIAISVVFCLTFYIIQRIISKKTERTFKNTPFEEMISNYLEDVKKISFSKQESFAMQGLWFDLIDYYWDKGLNYYVNIEKEELLDKKGAQKYFIKDGIQVKDVIRYLVLSDLEAQKTKLPILIRTKRLTKSKLEKITS